MEADRAFGTLRAAFEAADALRLVGTAAVRNRFGGTPGGAGTAGGAALAHLPRHEGVPGHEPEKSPERAEILAPEAPLDEVEGEDAEKDRPHGKSLAKAGRRRRQHHLVGEVVEGLPRGKEHRRMPGMEGIVRSLRRDAQHRVDGEGQGPDEQGDGIEESRELDGKEGGGNEENEDGILPAAPGRCRWGSAARAPEGAGSIVQGAEGTDPAAEDAPQEERQDDHDKGKEGGDGQGVGRHEGGERDERVRIEENPHRVAEDVVPAGPRLEKQPQEDEQKDAPAYGARRPHRETRLILIRARSIVPSPAA